MKNKEKQYIAEVDIKFTQIVPATSKKEARQRLIETFEEEYNLTLTDEEIITLELS